MLSAITSVILAVDIVSSGMYVTVELFMLTAGPSDTAFVRNRGQWHELNDSKIGRLTEAQVASANKSAYTLWYSRRQT